MKKLGEFCSFVLKRNSEKVRRSSVKVNISPCWHWWPVKSPESHLARSHVARNRSDVARNSLSCRPKSLVIPPEILSSVWTRNLTVILDIWPTVDWQMVLSFNINVDHKWMNCPPTVVYQLNNSQLTVDYENWCSILLKCSKPEP